MGHNTTVVFFNDVINNMRTDPNLGEKIVSAIAATSLPKEHQGNETDIQSGNACVGRAIESHHADAYAVVAVGNNSGEVLGTVWPYGDEKIPLKLRILKNVADWMGFQLRRKPKR